MTDWAGEGLSIVAPDKVRERLAQLRAFESADTSKVDAEYQDEPNGEEQCDRCSMFVSGGYCHKVVALPDDMINPDGWCKFFESADKAEGQ